ncbi:MAG: 30S ribosome-binding factor RbfA [Verrucomicrobiota bacterium]
MNLPPSPSRRLQRVQEQLRRELSDILRREFSVEEVGLLNVNEVKVAPDLKSATVFLGFVGTAAQRRAVPEKLESRSGRLQLALGSVLRMKWTPVLRFLLDDSVEKANRVLAILDELERSPTPAAPAAPVPVPDPAAAIPKPAPPGAARPA